MRRAMGFAALALAAMFVRVPAVRADDLVEEYAAYIGEDDLYNSSHERLTQPWQIIRQDRANFHRFGVSQRGDQGDRYFASANNRDLMEKMISRGSIDPGARSAILRGNVMINVRIMRGRSGDYVDVLVYR